MEIPPRPPLRFKRRKIKAILKADVSEIMAEMHDFDHWDAMSLTKALHDELGLRDFEGFMRDCLLAKPEPDGFHPREWAEPVYALIDAQLPEGKLFTGKHRNLGIVALLAAARVLASAKFSSDLAEI